MAGIYFHIPFCKKACTYCDFHFSTSLKLKEEMLHAMKRELSIQKDYLQGQSIETIYFGGGTPSILNKSELSDFLEIIAKEHDIAKNVEITLEANPDNLSPAYLKDLKEIGINRLSIGIQSFFDEHLIWMNRTHNAIESKKCVHDAQHQGIENISIDLIFGYPLLSLNQWEKNLAQAIALNVPHISSYSMAVSPDTALSHQIKTQKIPDINEEQSAINFLKGKEILLSAGYDHYEISSFSKPDFQSKHNSNYWKGIPYLGVGPSAHSFNGIERQWNIRNNKKYIDAINEGTIPAEMEHLSPQNALNEQIMTQLRMKEGLYLPKIQEKYGMEWTQQILEDAKPYISTGKLIRHNSYLQLSTEGQLYADIIAADLFQ